MKWNETSWNPEQKMSGNRKGFEGVMELVCTSARIYRPKLDENNQKMLGIKDLVGNEVADHEADPMDDSLVMVLGFTLLSKAGDPNAVVNYVYLYGGEPFRNSKGDLSMHVWRKMYEWMNLSKDSLVEDMEGKPVQGLFYLTHPRKEGDKPRPTLWNTFAPSGTEETFLDDKFSSSVAFSKDNEFKLHKKIDPSSKYYIADEDELPAYVVNSDTSQGQPVESSPAVEPEDLPF